LATNSTSPSSIRPVSPENTTSSSRFRTLPLPPGGPAPGGDAPNPADPSGLTIIGAVQHQLSLRLVSTKAPLDTPIIDHAEKVPTEN
jgi:uncharacterized protein (TIGR03435 family)